MGITQHLTRWQRLSLFVLKCSFADNEWPIWKLPNHQFEFTSPSAILTIQSAYQINLHRLQIWFCRFSITFLTEVSNLGDTRIGIHKINTSILLVYFLKGLFLLFPTRNIAFFKCEGRGGELGFKGSDDGLCWCNWYVKDRDLCWLSGEEADDCKTDSWCSAWKMLDLRILR